MTKRPIKPAKLDTSKNQHRLLKGLPKPTAGGKKPLVKADSAGGVVFGQVDGESKILLIQHAFNHHWSLPKGYVEPGESTELGALREVREETGIEAEVIAFLGHINIHTTHHNHRMLRKLHIYLMELSGSPELKPELFDPEEGMIGQVAWFTPSEALEKISYPNLREVVEKAVTQYQRGSDA